MIGDDLITRAPHDDPRYAGVDLVARGRDFRVWITGISRLDLDPAEVPYEMRQRSEEIARELQHAGPKEIGRFATDLMFMYSEPGGMTPEIDTAGFLAWRDAARFP